MSSKYPTRLSPSLHVSCWRSFNLWTIIFIQGTGKPELALGNPWLWDGGATGAAGAAGAAAMQELASVSEKGSKPLDSYSTI